MARLSEYKAEYTKTLLDCMSKGMLDCEIYEVLDCAKTTFNRWKKEYPEFNEAYEKGDARCEAWWVRKMREKFEAGDDKGYKYCMAIVSKRWGYGQTQAPAVTQNKQINIYGNANLIDSDATDQELLDIFNTRADQIKSNPIAGNYNIIDITPEDQDGSDTK